MAKRTTIPLFIIIVFLLIALLVLFQNPGTRSTAQDITYSEFRNLEPHIRDIVFHGDAIVGHDDRNASFAVTLPHDPRSRRVWHKTTSASSSELRETTRRIGSRPCWSTRSR